MKHPVLPVEIVLAPDWWHHHEGITFDEDFFYHPDKRVAVERQMEKVLYDRFGRFGLGADHDKNLPVVGPVHLAAGYLISEMLGCRVDYNEACPPQVIPADRDNLDISADDAFQSPAFKKFTNLTDKLKEKHGRLTGDVNFAGILNTALDLRGQNLFMDMFDKPEQTGGFFKGLADVIERFTQMIQKETHSTSISVNRTVHCFDEPIFLHSECSHTMISNDDYEKFLMPFDIRWSQTFRPFGIHYCGNDPHRYAQTFAKLPHLDFLDVGSGGDVAELRKHLPDTFFNLRLSPVEIIKQTPDQIAQTIRTLVALSANLDKTGLCCINIDRTVTDDQIAAIFQTAQNLRQEQARS